MRFINWLKSLFRKPQVKAKDVVVDPVPKPNEAVIKPIDPKEPVIVEIDEKNDGSTRNPDWSYLWDNCKVTAKKSSLDWAVNRILANKNKYLEVQQATGVPWMLIAVLHYRESSLDFTKYLGNGQPLNRKTTWVPKGRGPFKSWYEGAVDALKYDKLDKIDLSSYEKMLAASEKYNGLGYRNKGIYSPYVWAGTQWYSRGKYVKDGKYDPFFVDQQLGVACILRALEGK